MGCAEEDTSTVKTDPAVENVVLRVVIGKLMHDMEWLGGGEIGDFAVCPWCAAYRKEGHDTNCPYPFAVQTLAKLDRSHVAA